MAFARFILNLIGRLLLALPDAVLRGIAVGLGTLIWIIPNRRKHIQQANLRLAFPDRPEGWYARIGRENFARLIEYGMFILIGPVLSEAELRRRIHLGPRITELATELEGRSAVIFVPHVTHLEALPTLPCLITNHPMAALFRPLRSAALSELLLAPRRRWGMRLITRAGGLLEAARIFSKGGWLGVPADQNARGSGTLVLFFNRPCSATPLPENLLQQFGGTFIGLVVRRTGFLRTEVDAEIIPVPPNAQPGDATIAGHEWLERTLRSDDNMLADWFWSHRRWRVLHEPRICFRLEHKRIAVPRQLEQRGESAWPRTTRVVVIPPPGQAAQAALEPMLARLRIARPDFEITFWAGPESPARDSSAVDRCVVVATAGLTREQTAAECQRLPEYVILLDPDRRWSRPVRRLRASRVFAPSRPGGQPFPAATETAPAVATPDSTAWIEPFFQYFGLPDQDGGAGSS